jgi:Protein of unknown function (DUF4239)
VHWFFYDLPIWVSMPTFILVFLALSWLILLGVRPWVQKFAALSSDWDRVLGYAMSSFGLFYGILLALIAVSVYENFQRVNAVTLDEVSTIATLYRNFSAFPGEIADELQEQLRQYTLAVVTVDWPLQEAGIKPTPGDPAVDAIQARLFSFAPADAADQSVHNQTIALFDRFVDERRDRIDETELSLPPLLWAVVAVGAVLNALMIGLVESKSRRIHLVMSGIIAVFVAMLIFTTASIDHPYSGTVSITSDAYQDLYDDVLTE